MDVFHRTSPVRIVVVSNVLQQSESLNPGNAPFYPYTSNSQLESGVKVVVDVLSKMMMVLKLFLVSLTTIQNLEALMEGDDFVCVLKSFLHGDGLT